jgi:biopolymer transport protein ExbD
MAEIDTGGGGKKKGPKKQSTKVDMTPMVDLAFLLITFFMLTTTFNKPQTMEVNMPDKNPDKIKLELNFKRALTVIMGKDDKVYFYQGIEDPRVSITDYSDGGLRKVLLDKKKEIRQTTGKDMFVVIKATEKSNYKNVVDVLDEMAITSAPTYALADITPADMELLKKNGLE